MRTCQVGLALLAGAYVAEKVTVRLSGLGKNACSGLPSFCLTEKGCLSGLTTTSLAGTISILLNGLRRRLEVSSPTGTKPEGRLIVGNGLAYVAQAVLLASLVLVSSRAASPLSVDESEVDAIQGKAVA